MPAQAATPHPETPPMMAMSRKIKALELSNGRLLADKADREAADRLKDIDDLLAGEFLDEETAKSWRSKIGAKKMSLASDGGGELHDIMVEIAALKRTMQRKALTDPLLQDHLAMSRGARPELAPVESDGEPDPYVMAKLTGGRWKPKNGKA